MTGDGDFAVLAGAQLRSNLLRAVVMLLGIVGTNVTSAVFL
jgi:hypothetical protein